MSKAVILSLAALTGFGAIAAWCAWRLTTDFWAEQLCPFCKSKPPIAGTDICETCIAQGLAQEKFDG